jgi:hypothetical protein
MAEQKFTIPEGRKTTPINSQIVVLYMKDVSTVPSGQSIYIGRT